MDILRKKDRLTLSFTPSLLPRIVAFVSQPHSPPPSEEKRKGETPSTPSLLSHSSHHPSLTVIFSYCILLYTHTYTLLTPIPFIKNSDLVLQFIIIQIHEPDNKGKRYIELGEIEMKLRHD